MDWNAAIIDTATIPKINSVLFPIIEKMIVRTIPKEMKLSMTEDNNEYFVNSHIIRNALTNNIYVPIDDDMLQVSDEAGKAILEFIESVEECINNLVETIKERDEEIAELEKGLREERRETIIFQKKLESLIER